MSNDWDDIRDGADFHDWAIESGLADNDEEAFEEYGSYLEDPDNSRFDEYNRIIGRDSDY